MAVEEKSVQPNQALDPEIEQMIQAGVHFGHKTSKTHPRMAPYIAGIRNTVHVINLEKTKLKLQEALVFLRQLKEDNKIILFVGTKLQFAGLIEEAARACGSPFVTERWIGGTLTNFSEMTKRFQRLQEIEELKGNEEEWEKYTKKEQAKLEKELGDLNSKFGGVKGLQRLPDVLFIVDLDENELATREAREKGIPIVAIVDTDINPEGIDYPIPANDDAVTSINYILTKVTETLGTLPLSQSEPSFNKEDEQFQQG